MRDLRRVATIDIKHMTSPLPLAVTMGEPAGIGGELSLKAWLARRMRRGRSSCSTIPARLDGPGRQA